MQIRLWGTRGSIPSPGPATVTYGGNTSCVELRLTDGSVVIIDAGSGIRALGDELGACTATLLLSHYHWDHIQGIPFFTPVYLPGSEIHVIGPEYAGHGPEYYLRGQMDVPYFPNPGVVWPGIRSFRTICVGERLEIGTAHVRAARSCHPQVTLGYRIEDEGFTAVYISDDEVDLAPPDLYAGLVDLARGADLLIHDAQYTQDEYLQRIRWGHSTPEGAVRLAADAGVRQLMLFHHDPQHGDQQVKEMGAEAAALAEGRFEVIIGREGDVIKGRPRSAVGEP